MKVVLKDKEVNLKAFVEMFSKTYFRDEKKIYGITYSQTCEWVEKTVLDGNIWERDSLARILAWKIGKIKHIDSNKQEGEDKEIVYCKGWEKCEIENPEIYGKPFYINKLFSKLNGIHKDIDNYIMKNDYESCYNKIIDNKISGIGPVYAITLLFFASRGKFPIYDRFAYVALKAINDKKIPKKGDSKKLKPFSLELYKDYIKGMKSLYELLYPGEEINYMKHRELDQALWIYGHGYKNV